MNDAESYGTTRKKRADVSYADIERAATDILCTGTRPTVEGVRQALNGGSPNTIVTGLNRYWQELGRRIAGETNGRQLPPAIADLATGLWQRALDLATESATTPHNAAAAALAALRTDSELKTHALALREQELDQLVRSRERTVKELEEHLRTTMAMVSKRDKTLQSLEARLGAALEETQAYRRRLAAVVSRAVVRHTRPAPVKPKKTKPQRAARVPGRIKRPIARRPANRNKKAR